MKTSDRHANKKAREAELSSRIKLVVLLCIIASLVALGVAFHQKQAEKPLAYDYFKERGYDKIKDMPKANENRFIENDSAPEPSSEPQNDIEEARVKAQRNIFLQD